MSRTFNRPTIALLIDWLSLQYQLDIWSGVGQAAQAHDINLITIVGGILEGPRLAEAKRNAVYQLANANNVDGILVSSSSLFTYLSTEERIAFLKQFQPIPLVLIGEQLPGFSSVSIDNTDGLRDVIVHLVENHQCYRLAFIGGPKQNWEARQRLEVYKAVLNEYQLPVDDSLIYYGDFTEKTGARAVEHFYEKGVMPCDAIVAANDSMALGALESLQARNVFVPDDILLTGFDNSQNSHLSVPAMTTVHQPTAAMAYSAAELLFEQMSGAKTATKVKALPTKAVIRQSCGCYGMIDASPQPDVVVFKGATAVAASTVEEALTKNKPQLIEAVEKTLSRDSFGIYDPSWAQLLYEAYAESWLADDPGGLLSTLENVSQWMIERELNIQSLTECVDILFYTSKSFASAAPIRKKLDDRQLQVHLAIDSLVQRSDLKYRSYIAMQDAHVRQLSDRLVSQKDLSGMFAEMSRSLPELGVSQFFLILYDQQSAMLTEHQKLPQWSYLAFAHDEGGSLPSQFPKHRFLTVDLLPGDLPSLGEFTTLLLLPLSVDLEQFGYLILKIDKSASRYHYDLIRDQVSIALQSLLPKLKLIADRNQLETEVSSKAYELALANEQLKAYTAELERRNQELEQFTRVARHELQEPLRKIRLFGDRLQAQYSPLLTRRGIDYIDRMQRTSAYMQRLIDELLDSTRVTKQLTTFNPVDLNQIVNEVVTALEAEITAVNGRVQVEPLPTIEAVAGQIYQLFYILIHNGLKFHRKEVPPNVVIKSQPLNDPSLPRNLWEITVADNGIGIDEMYRGAIFQRAHSSQKISSTRSGLTACRRVVTLHKGDMTVSSQPAQGTTFFIILPSNQG